MAKNQALYNMIRQGLLQRGARAMIADLAAAQAMLENNHGTDTSSKFNNYSNIKYVKQPGATQGRAAADGGYFAKYANMGAWLNDYKRVLNLNLSKQGKPWDAKNLQDYVMKLKMNNYFGKAGQAGNLTAAQYGNSIATLLKMYSGDNAVKYNPPAQDPFAPKTKIQRLQDQGAERRQVMDQRPGVTQERPQPAVKKPWSLQKWFEDLSSLNKALVIGAAGFVVSRVLR